MSDAVIVALVAVLVPPKLFQICEVKLVLYCTRYAWPVTVLQFKVIVLPASIRV